jgi:protein-L-isoaspartate(D-aspartate) O-methyltransferase
MEDAEKHQRQLLDRIRFANRESPISRSTENAYLQVPRHLFLSRYRKPDSKDWEEVRADNLGEHLGALYANGPLILSGDDGNIASTISQPALVLRMLDLMQLEQGQRIFELGAGSGWNAALMGHLVGPAGHVYSLEIIPEVARRAATAIDSFGMKNVSIIEADGGQGFEVGAPYDRAVFTAGTYDLPGHFYRQIKDDGLLLVTIKCEGGGDHLFLLRKRGNHFQSLESMPCAFVHMTGKYQVESLQPICVEKLPEWPELSKLEFSKTPFWWGGKGKQSFSWRTLGVRSFLSVTEPLFKAFKMDKAAGNPFEEHYFGLWDSSGQSLVIAKDDFLISYGSTAAQERLMRDMEIWLSLGMPTIASFQLQVYPSDFRLAPGKNQWVLKRTESQFLWSLAL